MLPASAVPEIVSVVSFEKPLSATAPVTGAASSATDVITGAAGAAVSIITDSAAEAALLQALQECGYNRTAAAARLGLNLRQIRYRIQRLGIVMPGASGAAEGDSNDAG